MEKDQIEVFDLKNELTLEKMEKTKQILVKFLGVLLEHKVKVMTILIILMLKIILVLSTPLAISKIIDLIVEGIIIPFFSEQATISIDFYKLGSLILALVGKKIVSMLLGDVQKYAVKDVVSKIMISIKTEIKHKLAKIPLQRCSKNKKEKFESDIIEDLNRVDQGLQNGFINGMTSLITAIGALIVMFKMNWMITAIIVISLVIVLEISARLNMNKVQFFILAEVVIIALWFKKLSFGQIQTFIQYVKQLSNPFEPRRLNSLWTAISSARHAFGLLEEL